MKILGISPGHDSSVCLYEDGKILSFYKEERLTRKKRDRMPIRSIANALNEIDGVDGFAFCSTIVKDIDFYQQIVNKFSKTSFSYDYTDSHHLQHASLAFYNSGFSEAAVVIIDRNGSNFFNSARESETIFFCSYPNNFYEVYKNYWIYDNSVYSFIEDFRKNFPSVEVEAKSMYGIVKVYEAATSLIGQESLENGKTMGLSSYGSPDSDFPDLFVEKTNIPNDFYFSHKLLFGDYMSSFNNLDEHSTNQVTPNNYKLYADFAYQVQKQTQEAALFLIKKAVEKTGCKNIVVSGGYALNVLANSFYTESFPDINFYFEPISDDSGNSIGGAMHLYRSMSGDTDIYPIKDTFIHGQIYDLSGIIGDSCTVTDICNLLSQHKSVAIFEGKAEGGPRALGHRSILFDPSHPESKDIVNDIKRREWYRPFAAAVLQEDAEKYFYMGKTNSSPYMTMAFRCKEETKNLFPGIVHVDNSCRIQTVNKDSGTLYSLLSNYKEKTGHGVLLNTSLNLAGQPLVESPEEAIKTLQDSSLDYLWFPEIKKLVSK